MEQNKTKIFCQEWNKTTIKIQLEMEPNKKKDLVRKGTIQK